MSYNNILGLLSEKDTKTKKFLETIEKTGYSLPYLISKTLDILRDDSLFNIQVSNENKVGLARMASMCFDTCYGAYMDIFILDGTSKASMDKTLRYGEIEVYRVAAKNGLRDATANEVEQGIRGLIAENIYPAGEETFRLLNLMMWAFTGENYYFRKAGYSLTYIDSKTVKETFYDMVNMSVDNILKMFKFVSDEDRYEKALKIINKVKRNGGYKYANYASDEIKENISIKQLVKNIDTMFPRGSDNKDYRTAISLVIKTNRRNVRLTPVEISFLRKVYDDYVFRGGAAKKEEEKVDNELKAKCERLLNMRCSGLIDSKHFAYTIITTLRKNNYTKCSVKQLSYINDAIRILDEGNANNIRREQQKEMISNAKDMADTAVPGILSEDEIDNTLANMSNMLANGLFEDTTD